MAIPYEFSGFWSAAQRVTHRVEADCFHEAFAFGDSEGMASHLAGLVLEGTKRATASLAWTYEFERKPQPRPGDLSIVLTWSRLPLCIIETTAVAVIPFMAVPADFAFVEGEGDKTLSEWRRNHEEFFSRECARIHRSPSPCMPVVCERFSVVYQAGGLDLFREEACVDRSRPAALLTIDGAWIHLVHRKLIAPPEGLLLILRSLPRINSFEVLRSMLRKRPAQMG